jgi:hypothetical protein
MRGRFTGYLLSPTHPVGGFKARFFAALGFDEGAADDFVQQVHDIDLAGDAADVEDTEFGRK